MNYGDPKLRERLAAEYALGTLRGPARRRFEQLLSSNGRLRDLARDWELRINLLSESAPAVEPPARVWDKIAQRIGPNSAPIRESWLNQLWDSLSFWRSVGALAATAAAALAFHVALQPRGAEREQIEALDRRLAGIESRLSAVVPASSHMAVLLDKDRRPMMNADLDVAKGRLMLRLNIKPPRDFTGRILEVWLVPSDGTPRSLGLFPSEKGGTTTVLVLPHEIANALASGTLAVSLEPSGGSKTGVPSGPVLFSGAVVPVDL